MQVKQQYGLIVFPKIFTILNFYSKGLYSLQISLTAQQQQTGTLIRGFPTLVQGPDAIKHQQKKAKVIIKENKLAYCSQNFYVTFSAQNFYFHTLPYFKIELERQKRYKVWVDFNLILTQYKISKNSQQGSKDSTKNGSNFIALGSIDEKVIVVDTKKLYINNLKQLNTYQRIIFSQADYFSYTDAYIFSMKSQTFIRPHQFTLYEFHQSPIQQRSRLHLVKSQELKALINGLLSGSSAQIKTIFNEGIVNFYKYMIDTPIAQYKNLAYVYQHFRAMMITLNNSTIIQNAIPFLDYIGKSIFPQNSESQINQNQLKSLIENYYQTDNQAEIYIQILHEAQLLSINKKWLFDHLCHILVKINYNVFQILATPIIKQKIQQKQRQFIYHGDIQKQKSIMHSQFIAFRKKYCQQEKIVQDTDVKHPFIMLEGYHQERQNVKRQGLPSYVIDNLVVFVHGYQGSDFDLQIAKYNLEMYNTHCFCLMSTAIQDQMDEPIQYLGVQLASQIKEHLKQTYNSYKRINFVGYSLGGIVIRQAMKHLQQFKDKMNIFMSLASPHAGTIDGSNILIKTGIWYLINFQNAKNLKQLHCQFEGKQQQNFILKKLSQCESLQWFKKFIVASSQQDSFVPYNSSRIDQIQSSAITRIMCQNIKKRVKKIQRVQVWFDVSQQIGTIDKILGRKAHIQFLENKVFLHSLFKLYANQF